MRVLRYINALSLDVVAGALICALFFSKLFNTQLPAVVLATLGLAVWSVYTIDHLWDASHSKLPATTLRHQLHKEFDKLFRLMVFAAITVGVVLFFYLPAPTQKYGLLLTAVILGYFLSIVLWGNKTLYHKEPLVALVYTCGIALGPYSLAQTNFSASHLLVLAQFGCLAFTNLLLFTYFETETDRQQDFGSFSRTVGKKSTRRTIITMLLGILFSVISACSIWSDNEVITSSQWVIAGMSIPLILLTIWPRYFSENDRYRVLGDAIFFIPLLVL